MSDRIEALQHVVGQAVLLCVKLQMLCQPKDRKAIEWAKYDLPGDPAQKLADFLPEWWIAVDQLESCRDVPAEVYRLLNCLCLPVRFWRLPTPAFPVSAFTLRTYARSPGHSWDLALDRLIAILENWVAERKAVNANPRAQRKDSAPSDDRDGNGSADPANADTPDGFYSPADIAKAIGSPEKVDAIRMALKRLFEEDRLPDAGWLENANPARGQPKILYRLSVVRPLIERFAQQ